MRTDRQSHLRPGIANAPFSCGGGPDDSSPLDAQTILTSIALPLCPACGDALVGDRAERSCRRCGRAFSLTIEARTARERPVYRDAAPVRLEPLRDRRPLGPGLRIGKQGAFDVSIGGLTLVSREWQTIARVAFVFALLLPIGLMVRSVPWGLFLPSLVFLGIDIALRRTRYDRLSIDGGAVVLRRFRGRKLLGSEAAALSDVVGAHDAGDHVRIDLEDGRALKVGDGLHVRRDIRRWVARRIAGRAPRR